MVDLLPSAGMPRAALNHGPAVVFLVLTACSSATESPPSTSDTGHVTDGTVPQKDAAVDGRPRTDGANHDAARTASDAPTNDRGDAEADGEAGVFLGLCADCIANECMPSARACDNDSTCAMWGQCAAQCLHTNPAPTCFQRCDAQYAAAGALFGAVYSCMCTSCTATCGGADPCAHGADGGP